jgi:hypothetical protein
MKSLRSFLVAALFCALSASCSFLTTGCASRDLDPAGVYQGDKVLYETDRAITNGYSLLNGFVKWEYENRALLVSKPEITKAADNVRVQAKGWFDTLHVLRAAYVTDPSPGNRDKLQQTLSLIQAAIAEATKYMALPPPPAPAAPAS